MIQSMEEDIRPEDEVRALPDRPPRHCSVCGARVAEGAKTCLMCGTALEDSEEPPVPEFVAPPKHLSRKQAAILAFVAILILGGSAALGWRLSQSNTPSASPTPTQAAAITPLPTATPTTIPTPTPTPTQAPTPTPLPPQSYTVQSGDTLGSIAYDFDMTVDELMAFNGLDSDIIVEGQTLLIPPPPPTPGPTPTLEPGQPTATPAAFTTHIVKSGEALSTIAEQYGVSVEAIRAANPDLIPADSDTIHQGDALVIPLVTPTPQVTAAVAAGLTPTAPSAYDPPAQLFPPNGATFDGANAVVVLQWASVGILQANQYYQVELTLPGAAGPETHYTYVRTTAWRVPAELFPPAQLSDRTCSWRVAVVRQTAQGDTPNYNVIGPPGVSRTFYWTTAQP